MAIILTMEGETLMSQKKKKYNQQRRLRLNQFLCEQFFEPPHDHYAVETVGDWVLTRNINGNTGNVEVHLYTNETYRRSRFLHPPTKFEISRQG